MKKKVFSPKSTIKIKDDFRDHRLVIGMHAVREVLKIRPKAISKFFIKTDWSSSQDHLEIVKALKSKGIPMEERGQDNLDKLGSVNQGVACFVSKGPEFKLEVLKEKDQSIVLFIDGVEDPHNLGAILRTAWLMGVDLVIIPQDRAVGLTPTVHKVACGAVEHVPVLVVNNFANLIAEFKENGFWIYGLSSEGKKEIYQLKLPKKVAWVMGAEDKGLRITTERLCDELVSIPQINAAASYNVSVSAAIALAETCRQIAVGNGKK